MAIRLILFQNDQKLAVEIADGTYILGREEPADIVVPNASVSRRHAELQVSGTSCIIRDMASSNGTTVNGVKVTGPQKLSSLDEVRLGSARIAIEPIGTLSRPLPASGSSAARAGSALPRATPVVAAPAHAEPLRREWSWAVSTSIAALISIAVFALLMTLVGWFWSASAREAQVTASFNAFAAQYVHLLSHRRTEPLPAPIVNQYMTEPVMVLDRDGHVLYPAPAGVEPPASPLIDSQTGRVPDAARQGMYKFRIPASKGPPIRAMSFPIAQGGDVFGFVVAQPAVGESNFLAILAMIACIAAIALLVHYFAARPVISQVRRDIDALREKVTAMAHEFGESLPRSTRMPELNGLAAEVERALRAEKRGEATLKPSPSAASDYATLCATLLDAAHVPYCFIDSNFNLLASNADFTMFQEFAGTRRGKSIFDSDLPSLESKQLVRSISDARTASESSVKATLVRDNQQKEYVVHVKQLVDRRTSEVIYGLLFEG